MNAKGFIKEYKDWLKDDCLTAIKWVKPSLAQNIQGLTIEGIKIFENDNTKIDTSKMYSNELKRLTWEMDDSYFETKRIDTFQPWRLAYV
jgi:hypothetical protein